MSRGYQPDDQLDPRVSSDRREPSTSDPRKTDDVREQASTNASQSPSLEPERPGTRTAEARTVHEQTAEAFPAVGEAQYPLAFFLATCPVESLRDPARAKRVAATTCGSRFDRSPSAKLSTMLQSDREVWTSRYQSSRPIAATTSARCSMR